MFGSSAVIGVKPAEEYQFRVFTTPVGPYFKGGAKPITIRVSDYDRAAPHGTGHIKAGLNYAMSLYPIMEAHRQGFDENMYLDAATRTKVEETGGANFIFVTKDGKVVTPKSDSLIQGTGNISKKTVGADALHPLYYNIQYPGYLEKTRALGLKTHAWTVNEEADMKALTKAGIEAIITNYPDKARKIIQETGGTGNV